MTIIDKEHIDIFPVRDIVGSSAAIIVLFENTVGVNKNRLWAKSLVLVEIPFILVSRVTYPLLNGSIGFFYILRSDL